MLTLLLFLLIVFAQSLNIDVSYSHDLITGYGYPFEEHFVTTEDGYILRLFRIPYGRNDEAYPADRPPFLLSHGIQLSSDLYIEHGPELSPAFYFANRGYDVWMMNSRWNYYSRNHTYLDPDQDPEFWDVDVVDMSKDILPVYEYILNLTKYQNLIYYSILMSSTYAHIAISNNLEYFQNHTALSIHIWTMNTVLHTTSALFKIYFGNPYFLPILRSYGINELVPFNQLVESFHGLILRIFPFLREVEQLSVFGDASYNDPDLYTDSQLRLLRGWSIKAMEHANQWYHTQEMRYFDYGLRKNLEKYGSEVPPFLNLNSTGIPIAIISTENDITIPNEDFQEFYKLHNSEPIVFNHTYNNYDHASFFIGKDMRYLDDLYSLSEIYPPVRNTQL